MSTSMYENIDLLYENIILMRPQKNVQLFFTCFVVKNKKKITKNSYVLVLEEYLPRLIGSQTLRIIAVARLGYPVWGSENYSFLI